MSEQELSTMRESMERFEATLSLLTNQNVAQKEELKQALVKITSLEADLARGREARNPAVEEIRPLARPRTIFDLAECGKIPDCIKDLQIFEGNAIEFESWANRIESILTDHEMIREKSQYRAMITYIRQKIRGPADIALTPYGVLDDDWPEMKRVLSLHYADKRDLSTLELQLHLREELTKVLHYFTAPKTLVSDNERGLLCPTVLNFLKALDIEVYYAPTQ